MSQSKPHLGNLTNWHKTECNGGLGYLIEGTFDGHPHFDKRSGHTSYIVKHEGNEIETRNSRYTLVGDAGE